MFQEYFQQLNNLNESYPLEEVFEIHDQLNPQLFQDNYLKPEIRKQLLKIVDEFISYLKEDNIPLDVIDYWLLGSNAAYNYSSKSDIDVHIIVNMEDLGVDPYILQVLYNYIKSDFNKKYDIEVKGHEVELYIEDVRSGAVTNGIYSLLKDKWVKEPIKTEYMYFDVIETDEYKEWLDRYESLPENEIEQFINDLYLMRKESLATDGEWGTGNLIFKEFRNLGYLDSLKDRKYKYRSKELTLEGLNEGREPLFFYKVLLKTGGRNYAISEDPSKLKGLDYKKQYCLQWKNNNFIDYKGGCTLFYQGVVGSREAAKEYSKLYPNFTLL